jgi:nucleotide-binding universal stress UspA family protein
MNRSIVCGVDGTQAARWAARVAGDLARDLDRTLVLVHVAEEAPTFPYGDSRLRELRRRGVVDRATPMLERTAAEVPDVTTEISVVFGDPAEALMMAALEADAGLLVVGSRGRGPIASMVMGSVSARLASTAPCPVVVVPSPEAADRWLARPLSSRVVSGVDGSLSSVRALAAATELAERLDLVLSPVHVDAGDAAPVDGLDVSTVSPGKPDDVLREYAVDADASLLVVGSRGRTAWGAPLGSVSFALAADSPVPVMIVPPTAATGAAGDFPDASRLRERRRTRRPRPTAAGADARRSAEPAG